jgi:hypothetical protein
MNNIICEEVFISRKFHYEGLHDEDMFICKDGLHRFFRKNNIEYGIVNKFILFNGLLNYKNSVKLKIVVNYLNDGNGFEFDFIETFHESGYYDIDYSIQYLLYKKLKPYEKYRQKFYENNLCYKVKKITHNCTLQITKIY